MQACRLSDKASNVLLLPAAVGGVRSSLDRGGVDRNKYRVPLVRQLDDERSKIPGPQPPAGVPRRGSILRRPTKRFKKTIALSKGRAADDRMGSRYVSIKDRQTLGFSGHDVSGRARCRSEPRHDRHGREERFAGAFRMRLAVTAQVCRVQTERTADKIWKIEK